MSEKKWMLSAKLIAANQEESLPKQKKYFKNLPENPPEITNRPIKNYSFSTRYQSRAVYRGRTWCSIKRNRRRKVAGLDEIPS